MQRSISVITKLNALLGLLLASVLGTGGYALLALRQAGVAEPVFAQAVLVFAAIFATTVLFGVLLRLSVRHGILRSIRAAAHVVDRVGEGDLTARVGISAHGETQRMLRGIDRMTADLGGIVGQVVSSAHAVADASAQIAQGNRDLAQRTEEQASTLEETASSMEELTATVSHNAQNALQASQLAATASQVAAQGGAVVGQVVQTMDGITQSSRRIGDIIGVIDGIAFQTNILALNAAVEAARAGDHGRGFAVVAAEVRNLAQRSAAAAKEIKTLIGDSVDKVEAGSRLVGQARHTMEDIVGSVRQVSDLVAEIAAASRQQSAGIGQVNTAIAQMDQVVQQNAALVEEASAATESMAHQATVLLETVARFRVGEAARPAPALTPVEALRRAAPPAAVPIRVRPAQQPVHRARSDGTWEEF
jgi:methyl-accepting chemotaxis protein